MDNHRRLAVWHEAGDLILAVYHLADSLPNTERFVANVQLRRAAWSVQNNLAEGNAKFGPRERRRFFDIALGSLAEIDSMLGTLGRLYQLDGELVATIHGHRRQITAFLFALIRRDQR